MKSQLLAVFLGAHLFGVQLVTFARVAASPAPLSLAQQPVASPKPTSLPIQAMPPTQTREEDDVVRITTNLVQVDAVIVDKNGRPVTDLKPDEMRIYEDNRLQRITNFSYIGGSATEPPGRVQTAAVERNATGPPAPPVTLRPEDVRRTIALVVDDLGLSFQSIYFVRRALKKFVDEQMQAGDLVAIVRTSGGIGALQQFTADKRQLHAAIDQVKWYSSRSGINAFAPLVPPTPGAFGAQMDADNAEADQFREDVYAVGTLGAINYVVKGLHELPGRKSILLISDGFRIFNRDDPTRNDRTRQRLQQLIDQANRASVVIYTMNATGLATRSLAAEDSLASNTPIGIRTPDQMLQAVDDRRQADFETQEGLDYLARETGGVAVRNNNDLAGGIKKVMDDQQGYYLIGYRPDQSTFDPKTGRRLFHKLSLKVARPGQFSVRTRTGFYGIADGEVRAKANTPRDQILGALFAPFGAAGVHTQLTSLFANDARLGSYLRSILYVKAADLTFTEEADGWHKATFDVVAVTFGDNGNVIDQLSRTHELRVRGDSYQNVLQDGFIYFVSFPIKKPGAYQLRTVLRDHDSQRLGSASQFVEVPDLKKSHLALSGVVGAGIDPKMPQKNSVDGAEKSADGTAGPGGLIDEGTQLMDPQASEAVRHFRTGMELRYGFVIYNARLDQNTRQPELEVQARLFRGGQAVFTGKVQPFTLNNPPDLSRLRAASAVRLGADLPAGEYILQITVNDLLADPKHRTAIQWMDFEIVK